MKNYSKVKKDKWWNEHHECLIDIASSYNFDDWTHLVGKDLVQPTMDSTGKHKGLTLLSIMSIKELNELITENED